MPNKSHELKIWTSFFLAVKAGYKTFEIRKNDRDFQVGDTLILQEYNVALKNFTGNVIVKKVSYIMRGEDGDFGLVPGFCILGLRDPNWKGED